MKTGSECIEPMNNFTPRAQQVLALARKEADRLRHNFVGTEHLLLGIVSLGQGTAVYVLGKMGLPDLEIVRQEVLKQVGTGPDEIVPRPIPYTPHVKKALALAAKEAASLRHTYVGTEHILLGLLREGDGVAGRVLRGLGLDPEVTRQYVLRELDPDYAIADREQAISQTQNSKKPPSDIDTSRRYDVYCCEGEQQVVYRNAFFKGMRTIFPKGEYDPFSQYIELEQADGRTIFVARSCVIKFCEPCTTPDSERPFT